MGKAVKFIGRTFGGFITGGIDNAVASLKISLALVTGNYFAAAAIAVGDAVQTFAGGKNSGAKTGTPTLFRQSISDSFIVYGKRRVGGLLVFSHAKKVGKDHFRYFAVACAGHRCQGVVQWMLNDEVVTVDGSGKVTSGTYANVAWLWFQRGLASETANATFVAECEGKWTTAHKGNGVAAFYAKFKLTDDAVQAGMPNITAVIEGRDEILDPRTGTTGYTNNAILVAYDWMALPREEGGFGSYDDEIPDDAYISAQANVCDEVVGGEARYAIDAVITTGAPPKDLRDELVVNCAGSYAYSGGKHLIRPGYWVPVSVTLEEADLAGAIQVSAFLAGDQASNQVLGTFVDPNGLYQEAAFDTQTAGAPASIVQANLDLRFVTSKARANRIASIMLKRAQCEKIVTWPANLSALGTMAMDTLQFGTARYGLSNYAFVCQSWGLSSNFGITLTGREENEEIYDEPAAPSTSSVAAISQASALLTAQQASVVIANSFTDPSRILTAAQSGGTASITIANHTRVYPGDGTTASITGTTITGLLTDTPYFVYYDDLDLDGTGITFVATTNAAAAQIGVGRHSLGRIRTPISGSTTVYQGGGVYPTGSMLGAELP